MSDRHYQNEQRRRVFGSQRRAYNWLNANGFTCLTWRAPDDFEIWSTGDGLEQCDLRNRAGCWQITINTH